MRLRRASLLAGAAALAAALAPSGAQAATPSTFRLTGVGPEHSRVDVARPGGGTTSAKPGLYRYRVSPDGEAAFDSQGYCVDLDHRIRRDVDYRVDLEDDSDDPLLASLGFRSAGWLLGRTDALLATAAANDLEAGAIQIAVWQLTGQAAPGPSPTGAPRSTPAPRSSARSAGPARRATPSPWTSWVTSPASRSPRRSASGARPGRW